MLVIPAPVVPTDDPLGSLNDDDVWASATAPAAPAPAAPAYARPNPAAKSTACRRRPQSGSKKGLSLDPELLPFLKRLGLGLGAVCAVILLTAIGGFFSEPVAIVATVIGVVAMVGLVLAGRIWFVVIAFQENVMLGVASIFVPLLWSYCLAKQLRRSQLAFALLVSALIPGVVTLGVAGVFTARYSPEGRKAARSARSASNADKMVKMIREHETKTPPSGEPREAVFVYSNRVENAARFISDGDSGLSQFEGYTKGSLAINETDRTVTLKYRGANDVAAKYRLYLGFKTNVFLQPRSATE